MPARRTLVPGQKGTKKLQEQYGTRLICVRYHYDPQRRRRYKTVELVVEEAAWTPPARSAPDALVAVTVTLQEVPLQRQIKQAGGKWNATRRVWELRYDRALALGLAERIVSAKVSTNRNSEKT